MNHDSSYQRPGREVTNENLRHLGMAFFVYFWARIVGAAIVPLGAVSSAAAVLAYGFSTIGALFACCVAGLAAMRCAALGWMLWHGPLGTRQLTPSRAVFAESLFLLPAAFLAAGFLVEAYLLLVPAVVSYLFIALFREQQLPPVVVEVAWIVMAEDVARRGTRMARRDITGTVVTMVFLVLFVPLVWPEIALLTWFLACLSLVPLWLENNRLFRAMSHYLANVTAEEVRHARSELEDPPSGP